MKFRNQFFVGAKHREKDYKKALVYSTVLDGDAQTRTSIQHLHQLRAATVSNAVQELIDDRLLFEVGVRKDGTKGRPEILLYPNVNRFVAISIHSQYLMFFGNLMNLRGESIANVEIDIPKVATNHEILHSLHQLVSTLQSLVPDGAVLTGIGISLVGVIDSINRCWVSASRWPNLRNLNLVSIEELVSVSMTVRRSLDTELDYHLLDKPETRNGLTLLVHWGHGIGAAYAYHGEVLSSRFGKYADLGHMIIDPENKKHCRCGRIGCLETDAAVWSLVDQIRSLHPNFSEDSMNTEAVLSDPRLVVLPAVASATRYMSLCLANALKAFVPDHIFLVGPFFKNQGIMDSVTSYIGMYEMEAMKNQVSVEVVQRAFDGCKIGNVHDFLQNALRAPLIARL